MIFQFHMVKFSGGTNTDGAPCTLNGFTGARNREILPEWKVTNKNGVNLRQGAELHKVVDGVDTLIGIFIDGKFKPVS